MGDFTAEMERTKSDPSDTRQRERILEKLIRSELLYAEALSRGYEKDPEIAAGLRRLIAAKLQREDLAPRLEKLAVGEEEVAAYHRDHPEEFSVPRQVRPAVIEIRVPAQAPPEKRDEFARRAETALEEARKLGTATRSFGSVAVKYSDDQATRYRGGDAGLIRAGQREYPWGKEVLEAIFALKEPGELGPVVASPGGFYLVKLMEVREGRVRPLEEVKELIIQRLLGAKRRQAEDEFFKDLWSRIPVAINREALEAITWDTQGGTGAAQAPPPLPTR